MDKEKEEKKTDTQSSAVSELLKFKSSHSRERSDSTDAVISIPGLGKPTESLYKHTSAYKKALQETSKKNTPSDDDPKPPSSGCTVS